MRVVVVIFGLLAAILLISSPIVEQHLGNTRPHQIDESSGRVYEVPVRGGQPVYLTKAEYVSKSSIFYGGISCAIVFGWLLSKKRRR